MRSLALLAVLLSVASCQTPSAPVGGSSAPLAMTLRYSVKKSAPGAAAAATPAHFVVEASLLSKGAAPQTQTLVIYDSKWATMKVGEVLQAVKDIEPTPDGEDAVPVEVDIFTGTLFAFRCREAKDGRIETNVRVYEVRDGRLRGRFSSNDTLGSGESKELPLMP
ncbi:MAG TPA: hypothetical protein VK661_04610 [Planctomycetota bacterium]|nr:hypothetical protein [Planctomycetota bacterium]